MEKIFTIKITQKPGFEFLNREFEHRNSGRIYLINSFDQERQSYKIKELKTDWVSRYAWTSEEIQEHFNDGSWILIK